ncbi:hypothetical protein BJ741DRAFT_534465 [Chytriomyces cf. hyalinus JEL632]|nr:hypothetical protein BJ741DRAFT_534465 [Chytriomyces cf. hyalinus JEL632]
MSSTSTIFDNALDTAETQVSVSSITSSPKLNSQESTDIHNPDKEHLGICGLKNLGNTCYMNSALQCLLQTRLLISYFLRTHEQLNQSMGLKCAPVSTLEKDSMVQRGQRGFGRETVNPRVLKKAVSLFNDCFAGSEQQDAQEFLQVILDALHEDLKKQAENGAFVAEEVDRMDEDPSGGTEVVNSAGGSTDNLRGAATEPCLPEVSSPIAEIFQGSLKSNIECMECHASSIKAEPFVLLSLPVSNGPDDPEYKYALETCLREFLREELLGKEDTWFCPTCKDQRQIKKRLDVQSLPEVLIFHLKRFSTSYQGFENSLSAKIEGLVRFPISGLDMSDIVNRGRGERTAQDSSAPCQNDTNRALPEHDLYDLYAVSNHFGGLNGGHYTAFVKSVTQNEWFHMDDSKVSPIHEDDVVVSHFKDLQRTNSHSHSISHHFRFGN